MYEDGDVATDELEDIFREEMVNKTGDNCVQQRGWT